MTSSKGSQNEKLEYKNMENMNYETKPESYRSEAEVT